MDFLKSIVMGVIQGVTEFLPVSSSGHLAIMKHILHINTDTGLLFDVLLHLGTLVSIFIVFWKDIQELILEGFKILGDFFGNTVKLIMNCFREDKTEYKKVLSTPYRRFVILIILSTIPTAVIGLVFESIIEIAGATVLIPGLCLILTGILLQIADRVTTGKKSEENASFTDAGLVGLAQGVATLPGLSRSGTTITACLLCGFDRSFAVKYSFIMSIPAVMGAVVLQLKDFSMDMLNQSVIYDYIAGTIVAGIMGYFCIKTMLVIVKGKKFKYFAYYCFIVGSIAVISNFVF
ncbi:MAG: Undecaprenyl-diphosphatase [Herbinix sp.]|jgi:undecaprenyl-diphosphatase|nr:Undecaprenyl-diphosphatase [Herbinix sp.]